MSFSFLGYTQILTFEFLNFHISYLLYYASLIGLFVCFVFRDLIQHRSKKFKAMVLLPGSEFCSATFWLCDSGQVYHCKPPRNRSRGTYNIGVKQIMLAEHLAECQVHNEHPLTTGLLRLTINVEAKYLHLYFFFFISP